MEAYDAFSSNPSLYALAVVDCDNRPVGILNRSLEAVGLGMLRGNWLNDPATALPSVALVYVWYHWGFGFLLFLAGVNLTIGLINLIPLLPFDGGHVAVACYEKVRELIRGDGKRYFVDANKLMAPTYAVVIIMVFVGLLAGYSDIVRPIQL